MFGDMHNEVNYHAVVPHCTALSLRPVTELEGVNQRMTTGRRLTVYSLKSTE
jgi:hypothetical protein